MSEGEGVALGICDPILDLSLRVRQSLGADFRRKSEIRTPPLEARKRQTLTPPVYFFCGSNIFSPFLNTP